MIGVQCLNAVFPNHPFHDCNIALQIVFNSGVVQFNHGTHIVKLFITVPDVNRQGFSDPRLVHDAFTRIGRFALEQRTPVAVGVVRISFGNKIVFPGMVFLTNQMNGFSVLTQSLNHGSRP